MKFQIILDLGIKWFNYQDLKVENQDILYQIKLEFYS